MWIYDPDRTCIHCGVTDTAFFAQRQRGEQIAVNNICQPCKSKERSKYYYENDKFKRVLKYRLKEVA